MSVTTAPSSSVAFMPQTFDEAARLAKAMASAKLVPEHLQGDAGSCLLVIEQAMRWHMSPFAVAQCTSVISGKLMWEGKLVAAAVETMGAIQGGFDYQFSGKGDELEITVSATRAGEAEPRSITVKIADVRTKNGIWLKQPEQQMVYAGTRIWARRWTPAALLGVYAPEEFDAPQPEPHRGPTIEHSEAPPVESTPPSAARQAINAAVPMVPEPQQKPPRMTIADWLDSVELALKDAGDNRVQVDRILFDARSMQIAQTLRNGALLRYNTMKAAAIQRANPAPPEEEVPEETGDGWPGPDVRASAAV